MARRQGVRIRLVCAAILLLTTPHIQAEKCRSGCNEVSGPESLVHLADGTTYRYNVEGRIDLGLSSAEGSQTTKLTATALVSQQPDCVRVLRLQNVQLVGADGKKQSIPGIDKPVSSSGDEICADPQDLNVALNIKRAVLSLLRPGAHQDAMGRCGADSSQREEKGVTIVTTSRDLTRCSEREHLRHNVLPSTVNLHSVAGTGPIFARYGSEHRIKGGILESASVTEDYLYKPFSDGRASGVNVHVSTNITLQGQKKEAVNVKASVPHPLRWSPAHEDASPGSLDSLAAALKEAAAPLSHQSAAAFLRLLRLARGARKADLLALYGQVKSGATGLDKDAARRLLLSALFRSGSGDAVEVAAQLIKSKELKGAERTLAFLSIGYTRHASKASLNAATALLDQADLPREAYLGVGSLAGRYCQQHPCPVDELGKLQLKLLTKAPAQPTSRQAESVSIAALRALGSSGPLAGAAADRLAALIGTAKAPTRLRAAALEAARGVCGGKVQAAALQLLKNRAEDAELRIRAYLVLVQCPDQAVAKALQELIDDEPVYQVGGYIVSHLAALRASVNPDRAHAQRVLSSVQPHKQFPIDPRKFSIAGEVSGRWDSLGVSGVAEGDLIYSGGWLPRAASLNLTAELMGHNLNFVEVDVRQENLERIVEHYLGPLGVLRHQVPPSEWVSQGRQGLERVVAHIRERLQKSRGKRDVSRAEIDAFAKTVKQPGSDLNRDLDVDLNVRLFGSELLFLSMTEELAQLTPDAIVDRLFDGLDSGLDAVKQFKYSGSEHLLLTDVESQYPTSTGLPLRWNLQTALAARLQASGGVDIRQLVRDPANAQLRVALEPAANLEAQGGITVLTPHAASGLRITANALTSTGLDVQVQLVNAKGVDVKVGLPVAKQQIVRFEHTLQFANEEQGKREQLTPLKFKDKSRPFSICFDQLSPLIGLELCGELDIPSTLATNRVGFPLNGNILLELSVNAEDVKEFHLKGSLEEPAPGTKALALHFSTPGSKADRTVELTLTAASNPPALKAHLQSPIKAVDAELALVDSPTEKALSASLRHDNQEYLAKVGVSIKSEGPRTIYSPLVRVETPADRNKLKSNRAPDYSVEGQIIREQGDNSVTYTLDKVRLIAPGQPPLQISGTLGKNARGYHTDISLERDQASANVKGRVQVSSNQLELEAGLTNSINPAANFKSSLELRKGDRDLSVKLDVAHGADLKHSISASHNHKYQYTSAQDYSVDSSTSVAYPLVALQAKAEFKLQPRHYQYNVEVQYDKTRVQSDLEAKLSPQGGYNVQLGAQAMTNKLQLTASRQVDGDVSQIKNHLDVSGRKYSLDGKVNHKVKPNDVDVGADLTLKVHGRPEPLTLDSRVQNAGGNVDAHVKLASGSQVLVEANAKGSRAAGSSKLQVPQIISAEGNWNSADGQSTANLLVDLPRVPRKLKLQLQGTCKAPVHKAQLDLFLDLDGDKNNKIHISTDNHITTESLDTKNVVEYAGRKATLNAKGQQKNGRFPAGETTGQFELTLPGKITVSGNLDRQVAIVDNVVNGKAGAQLRLQRGDDVRTLEAKAALRDTNIKNGVLDGEWSFVAAHQAGSTGSDVKLDVVLKHNQNHVNYQATLGGSVLPRPVTTSLEADCADHGKAAGSVMYGQHGVRTQAEYDYRGVTAPGQPIVGDLQVELLLEKPFKGRIQGRGTRPAQPDGVYQVEGSLSGNHDGQDLELSGKTKMSIHKGELSGSLTVPNHQPITVHSSYNREKTENGGKVHGDIAVKYQGNQEIKSGLTITQVSPDEINLDLTVSTPHEKARSISLKIHSKRANHNRDLQTSVDLTVDGQRYSLSEHLVLSELSPSVEVKWQRPGAEPARVLARVQRTPPSQAQAELRLEHVFGLSLEAEANGRLQAPDDFELSASVNSEKLKLDHVKLEASGKAGHLQVSAKSGDKPLLSGSTNYKTQSEAGKLIIEGSGSISVQGSEPKSASFKYIQQQQQNGLEVVLNAGVGSQGVVAEVKLSERQGRVFASYCEEKKECAHVEISSRLQGNNQDISHELEVSVDLRKLGLSHELGLKATTKRNGYAIEHGADLHFQSGDRKYQYSIWARPGDAGLQLTLPGRTLALEGKGTLGNEKDRTAKAEIALYLDKAHEPNKKTVLSYTCTHKGDTSAGTNQIDIQLTAPGLARPLSSSMSSKWSVPERSASFSVELDVLAKKPARLQIAGSSKLENIENGYKLASDLTLTNKALNLDIKCTEVLLVSSKQLSYDLRLNYQRDSTKLEQALVTKATTQKAEILVKALNNKLLHVDSNWELERNVQRLDTKLSGLGMEDMLIHAQINNLNSVVATISRKATPQNKLRFSAALIPNQIADIRWEREKGGAKIEIAHASVKLDEKNFLKPDAKVDTEYIQKHLIPDIQKEAQESIRRVRSATEDSQKLIKNEAKQLNEVVKKQAPNVKPALEYYKQESIKIKDEVVKDAAIQELVEVGRKIFGTVLNLVATIHSALSSIYESLSQALATAFSQLTDLLSKEILPQVREISTKLLQAAKEIAQAAYDVVSVYVIQLINIIQKHEAELKRIGTVLSETLQDMARLVSEFMNHLRADVEAIVGRLYEQIRALPIMDELKQRYEQLISDLPVPDQLVGIINEVCTTIKDVMPTDEAKHLISVVQDLLARVLRREQIPASALEQLSSAAVAAVNSIIKFLQNQQPVDYRTYFQQLVPLSLSRLSIPEVSLPQISLIRLALEGARRVFNISILRGGSLHPRDHIPPFVHHGLLVRGQHIFTFDDRHLTFPGSCGYVLVQDAVNGNLSLVAELQAGALSALVFSDKKDTVRIAATGQVTRNGKAAELPVRTPELEVFRLYDNIQIVSAAGVRVFLEPNLHVVSVYVSGFYQGQLRGLFGNANWEPYDDLILPSGKLASSEAEFGNGYKVSASCAAVSTPDHSGHGSPSPSCQALFSRGSPLQLCFPVVPPEGYMQACAHDASAERDIALAYVARCHARNILISLPEQFLKCGAHSLTDTWSTKIPAKSADVVLIVEQEKNVESLYKELIQPVAQQLAADLSGKGIPDVRFSVIGFGGGFSTYPSHYTKQGHLSYAAPLPNLKFQNTPIRKKLDSGSKQVDEVADVLMNVAGELEYQILVNTEAQAVREALRYPWRPDASRIVIWLRETGGSRFSPLRLLGRYISEFSRRDGVYLSIAQPLELRNPPAQAKTLVGFGQHDALTLSDAKKRADNHELRAQLEWPLDHPVDYVLYRHAGHVFLTNNFQAAKGGQRKQFVQVMAHAIADDVAQESLGLDCSCRRQGPFTAHSSCRVVTSQPRKAGKA